MVAYLFLAAVVRINGLTQQAVFWAPLVQWQAERGDSAYAAPPTPHRHNSNGVFPQTLWDNLIPTLLPVDTIQSSLATGRSIGITKVDFIFFFFKLHWFLEFVVGVSSFLPPPGSYGSNSGHQAWGLTQPSYQPLKCTSKFCCTQGNIIWCLWSWKQNQKKSLTDTVYPKCCVRSPEPAPYSSNGSLIQNKHGDEDGVFTLKVWVNAWRFCVVYLYLGSVRKSSPRRSHSHTSLFHNS